MLDNLLIGVLTRIILEPINRNYRLDSEISLDILMQDFIIAGKEILSEKVIIDHYLNCGDKHIYLGMGMGTGIIERGVMLIKVTDRAVIIEDID